MNRILNDYDFNQDFFQWVVIAVVTINTLVALCIALRARGTQRHVWQLEGKLELMTRIMLDTGKKMPDDE